MGLSDEGTTDGDQLLEIRQKRVETQTSVGLNEEGVELSE